MKLTIHKTKRRSLIKNRLTEPAGVTVAKQLWLTLFMILLVFSLVGCSLPKKSLSGERSNESASGNSGPLAFNPNDAGGATLNIKRRVTLVDPNGSDEQNESGTVKLIFTSTSGGNLSVEGTGKMKWDEVAKFPACGFTAKADISVSVTGLFMKDDCMFHLTIDKKFSQPTTSNQTADCTYPLKFEKTEFSSRVVVDPEVILSKEVTPNALNPSWELETYQITDLKSDEVQNCFKPEVIQRTP